MNTKCQEDIAIMKRVNDHVTKNDCQFLNLGSLPICSKNNDFYRKIIRDMGLKKGDFKLFHSSENGTLVEEIPTNEDNINLERIFIVNEGYSYRFEKLEDNQKYILFSLIKPDETKWTQGVKISPPKWMYSEFRLL